ncbi:MAG TPA: 2OG-Fe(II) oxygenase [bacterium]|nr:2OG-Fe(II) oxygenase [bacterium]
MAIPAVSQELFPYSRWNSQIPQLRPQYRSAKPYPHIVLKNLLEDEVAQKAMNEFPKPTDTNWIQYKHFNERKLGKSKREEFPPLLGRLVDEFNSKEFLRFLTDLTGIENLLADPMLDGGGMHQSGPGGFLNIHADFTTHHYQPWRRRINLILYLNEGWLAEWNGNLEIWDKEMKNCVEKVVPVLNTAIIFNTDEHSHHGLPDKIKCPEGMTRKSLALYYYTQLEDSSYKPISTNYQARPGDGWRAPFIWLDKKFVHGYSVLKTRLGLSDDFASKILGFFGGRK